MQKRVSTSITVGTRTQVHELDLHDDNPAVIEVAIKQMQESVRNFMESQFLPKTP